MRAAAVAQISGSGGGNRRRDDAAVSDVLLTMLNETPADASAITAAGAMGDASPLTLEVNGVRFSAVADTAIAARDAAAAARASSDGTTPIPPGTAAAPIWPAVIGILVGLCVAISVGFAGWQFRKLRLNAQLSAAAGKAGLKTCLHLQLAVYRPGCQWNGGWLCGVCDLRRACGLSSLEFMNPSNDRFDADIALFRCR